MNAAGRRRSLGWAAVLLIAALVVAPPAGAHLVQTGLGAFADGAARLVLTPSDLLLACGLGALAVQQGAACGVQLRLALPLAWLLGGSVGLRLPMELSTPWLNTIAFSLVGLLVALQVPLGGRATIASAALVGLWFGLVNGSAQAFHSGAAQALVGGVVAVAALTAILTLALCPPHPAWLRIGLRVAGSWIAASGLLMVGWLIKFSS
jgi:hydrogenase/urease accessory protein HupE